MNLKLLRTQRGLTQKQLGMRIGVSQQYISKLEAGNINGLTIGKLVKLAKVLKVEPDKLLDILLEDNK